MFTGRQPATVVFLSGEILDRPRFEKENGTLGESHFYKLELRLREAVLIRPLFYLHKAIWKLENCKRNGTHFPYNEYLVGARKLGRWGSYIN
jgi:hypothetical protein